MRITLWRSAMRCWTPAATTPEGTACGAMRTLDLPETEAPHPGVSSGGVEVEGAVFVRASLTGNGSPKPGGDEMMKAWAKLRPGLGKLKGN